MDGQSGLIDKILADMKNAFPDNGSVSEANTSPPEPTSVTTPIPFPGSTHSNEVDVLSRASKARKRERFRVQNEVLIECIHKNPALWDSTDPRFNDQQYRQLVWFNIAEVLQSNVQKVRSRWAALRKNYKQAYVKKSATGHVSKMICYDKLGFLEEEIKKSLETEAALLLRAKALQKLNKLTVVGTKKPNNGVDSISLIDDDSEVEEIIDEDDDDCCIVDVVMNRPTGQNQPAPKPAATLSSITTTKSSANHPAEMDGIVSAQCLNSVRLRNISDLLEKELLNSSSSIHCTESARSTVTDTRKFFQKDIPIKKRGIKRERSPEVIFIQEKAMGPKHSKAQSLSSTSDETSRTENHSTPTPQQSAEKSPPPLTQSVVNKIGKRMSSEVQHSKESSTTSKIDKLTQKVRDLPEATITSVKRRNSEEPVANEAEPSTSVNSVLSKTATARKSTSRASAGLTLHKSDWASELQIFSVKSLPDEKEEFKKDVKDKLRDESANMGFLSSLLGDVETMSNAQFRVLKKHSTALVSMILDKRQ